MNADLRKRPKPKKQQQKFNLLKGIMQDILKVVPIVSGGHILIAISLIMEVCKKQNTLSTNPRRLNCPQAFDKV